MFFGVPRVWEKFREKVEENLMEAKGWKEIVLEKSRVRTVVQYGPSVSLVSLSCEI